jgi:DNA-binding XRE family transcriptional regulator
MRLNTYINEKAKRKDALKKVISAMETSKTKEQLKTAANMATNFVKMYDHTFLADIRDIIQDMTPKKAVYMQFWKILAKQNKALSEDITLDS